VGGDNVLAGHWTISILPRTIRCYYPVVSCYSQSKFVRSTNISSARSCSATTLVDAVACGRRPFMPAGR
jgi:hypothetical protein